MNLTYIFHVDGDVVHGEIKELPGCTAMESSLERCAVKLILAQETWVDGWLQGVRDRRLRRYSAPYHPTAPILRPIEFKTKKEAEAVLNNLKEILASYNIVTLSDFYRLCDVGTIYADNTWGWNSLDGTSIIKTPNTHWRIIFPDIIAVGR